MNVACVSRDTDACAPIAWLVERDKVIPTKNANPRRLSHGDNGNQDGQEIHKWQEIDNHDGNKYEESQSGANKEKNQYKVTTIVLGNCMPAAESPLLTVKNEMKDMLIRLGLSQMVAQKLVEDQGKDS